MSAEKEYKIEDNTYGYIEIEDGRIIQLGSILFSYEGLRETAVDQGLGDCNENCNHPNDTIVGRSKNSSHEYHDYELDSLDREALYTAPDGTFNGFLF